MGTIHFITAEDADELLKALRTEGYTVRSRENPEPGRSRWLLEVEPFDDEVVARVDVYGGWLPEETP